MKKIIYKLTCLALVAIIYSCTDQSTFSNAAIYEIEKGGFVRFSGEVPPGVLFEPDNISFSSEVYDANNNLSKYTLALKATISGKTYIANEFFVTTSFPATLAITSQNIAEALGISVSDISFGSLFTFTGIATRNDGTDFIGTPTILKNGQISGGNTEPTLYTVAYKQAMNFKMALACPPSAPGIYKIVMHDSFGDGWQTDGGNGGSGIQITIDDQVIEFGMCSPYGDGTFLDKGDCTPNDGFEAETTVEIPAGAALVLWEFPGDAYGEISFEIYDPNGVLIGEYGLGTPAGLLVLCDADPGT